MSHEEQSRADNLGKQNEYVSDDSGFLEGSRSDSAGKETMKALELNENGSVKVGKQISNESNEDEEKELAREDVCRDFLNNMCSRGSRCKFYHPPSIVRQRASQKTPEGIEYRFCIDYQMSRFLKPVDYSDDEDESRLVRAKPIDSKIARKLGSYAAGKDFVIGSFKSQQELEGSNMILENSSNVGEIMDDKTKLEWRNKLGAKILKAKLQGKMDLVEKLEKELHGQRESEEGPSSTCKILFGSYRSDMPMMEKDGKNLEKRGRVDAIHADKSIRDMVVEEKIALSKEHTFDTAKAVMKHRLDDDWVVDDAIMAVKRSRKIEEKMKRRDRNKLIKENRIHEQTLDSCRFCVEATCFRKQCLVACGRNVYLSSVPWCPLVKEHCLIVPTAHNSSTVTLDEDVYEEMCTFKKALVSMWQRKEMYCLFVETAKNVKYRRHMYIECIAVPNEIGEMAPIYFKKAIDESEGEWVDNKKLVDLSQRGGDVRKAIPKGFSYFAVDFGLHPGYAHVIENEDRFPQNFAHEIIGGMIDLDRRRWRMNESLTVEQQRANSAELRRLWKSFEMAKESESDK